MEKNINNISTHNILKKYTLHLILLILLLPFFQMDIDAELESENDPFNEGETIEYLIPVFLESDQIINLLGKSFIEIINLLGEPAESGYSQIFGSHHYIMFRYEEGYILFASPESLKSEKAVGVFLGPGQEVLGVKVGMRFPEIVEILGAPDFGPDIGLDDLYYLDYSTVKLNDQMPVIFISFVAVSIDSPTDHAFIKLEDYNLGEIVLGNGMETEN